MKNRSLVGSIGVVFFLALTVLAFQNCAGPEGFDTQASTELTQNESRGNTVTLPSTNSSNSNGSNNNNSSSVPFPSQPSADALRIVAWSSEMAQSDCSQKGAVIATRVENTPANILTCAEFVLDMPAGHPRQNEQFFCDSPQKFKAPDSSWTYDASGRVWKTVQDPYPINGSAFLVPGTYWLVVKDHTGSIHRSNPMRIARKGYPHCQAVSSGTPTNTPRCQWSGIVAGPEEQPTQSCSTSNVGATARNTRGTVFTCECK